MRNEPQKAADRTTRPVRRVGGKAEHASVGASACVKGPRRARARGVTLVELLVVVSIIGLLAAILLPVIARARESGRSAQCMNNLREIGIAMTARSDTSGDLCSGAFDWQRDGCVTEVGWVADLVNRGAIVGEMLCPSNPLKLHQVYNQLLTLDPAMDSCVDRLGSPPTTLPNGSLSLNPCRQLAALPPGAPRASIIETLVFEKGYNTNYAASWFLVRSELRVDASGNIQGASGCPVSAQERACTLGPLRNAQIGFNKAATTRIPLLGCAQTGDPSESVLSSAIGSFPAGTRLSASFTAGPVSKVSMQAPSFPSGTPYTGPGGWWDVWTNGALQDYRNFGPVHGSGRIRTCNILFADGSVRSFSDESGDGLLNNGFDPAATVVKIGYMDAQVELGPNQIFSGWSLKRGE
jgi:prepilin-type N-terminal cleavage/methylation domain-containing protein/prepilin-type processing-associated H-X9-DG protein